MAVGLLALFIAPVAHAIMAGGEFDLPSDSPSGRERRKGVSPIITSF